MQIPETEIIVSRDGAELLRKTVRPGDYVIGRDEGCELQVEVELVSRRHAQLTVNFDHVLIEDLGSSNGTFVNGEPIKEPTRLWPNQKIQVGAATIELRRIKTVPSPDATVAPSTALLQQLLPEEFLRDKKYEIGKVVAQGGMGAILEAKEATIQRRVAMKVMLDGSRPDDLTRFVAEAKITGQLEHPSIVPIYELSVDDNGQVFYTMKMVRGITLRKVLELLADGAPETVKKYPLPVLLTIFQKVGDAIAFAHSKGVIHRDLKPENIMLDDFGVVLVMDWGLAKILGGTRSGRGGGGGEWGLADGRAASPTSDVDQGRAGARPSESASATLAGTVMGTPQYMSPEQARGEVEDLDVRSDIYALGAILYHILALRPPVTGKDAWAIVTKVGKGEVEPLTAPKNRPIPDSIAAVVRKAMAFDRNERYPHVAGLQRDIEAYQNGFATSAERAGAWKQFSLFVRRNKAASIGVAAVLVLSIAFTAKVVTEGRRAGRALADLKKSAPALLQLARSEADNQRFESALEKLTAALSLDPSLSGGWWERTWLLTGLERWGDALAASRIAQEKEPVEAPTVKLLPALEEFAAAPSDEERWKSERAARLLALLREAKATATLVKLSNRLMKDAKPRQQLVQAKLDAWLGKGSGSRTSITAEGLVRVEEFPRNTVSIEPLRGLPIDDLNLDNTQVQDLGPLRGMPLRYLHIYGTPVNDLSPLHGMPLKRLNMDDCHSAFDLSPLAGLPLEWLSAMKCGITDLKPLQGTPLKYLNVLGNRITDLSPLSGAPLEHLNLHTNKVSDLTPLRGMPLQELTLAYNPDSDLAPLRGMPLRTLHIGGNHTVDLSPLRGMPLEDLDLSATHPKDLAPLMDLPQLETLHCSDLGKLFSVLRHHPTLKHIGGTGDFPYLPVEEFWKAYDTQHPATPK